MNEQGAPASSRQATGGTLFTATTVLWTDERKQYDFFGLFKVEVFVTDY